jgi:hypothetical protein
MFFAYYGRPKHSKNQMLKKLHFFISHDVMLKYIFVKKMFVNMY